MTKYLKKFENHSLYTAFTQTADFVKPNVSLCEQENEVHYNPMPKYGVVDLGLPSGTLWAKMNIGASNETDYGFYFQWGDIQGYAANQVGSGAGQKYFDWPDYKYSYGDTSKLTKYCNLASYGYENFTDTLTSLTESDDAAFTESNGVYIMPTADQINELINTANTIVSWDAEKSGCTITSKNNGNTLFLPACGNASTGSVSDVGSFGAYWTNALYATTPVYASIPESGRVLYFGSNYKMLSYGNRRFGYSIRGVINQ